MFRTNFYGPKDVRAIEVRLYRKTTSRTGPVLAGQATKGQMKTDQNRKKYSQKYKCCQTTDKIEFIFQVYKPRQVKRRVEASMNFAATYQLIPEHSLIVVFTFSSPATTVSKGV